MSVRSSRYISSYAVNLLFVLGWGLLSSCGPPREPARIRLGLYATFEHEPPAAIRHVVQEELAAMLIPIGVTVYWRHFNASPLVERWNELATVRFRGHCSPSHLGARALHPWVFGQTHVSDGRVIPYAEVQCDAIRAFLAPTIVRLPRQDRAWVFARAVARILAHELYHVLARTTLHGSTGVGRESYSATELAGEGFSFNEDTMQRLRAAIGPDRTKSVLAPPDHSCDMSQEQTASR